MNKKEIHFSFASDENYFKYFLVALCSAMNHSSKKNLYICHYFYDNISEFSIARAKKIARRYKNLELRMYPLSVLNLPDDLNDHNRYSRSSFARLKFDEFFKDLDKIIYFDCDSLIVDDIAKIYNENIDDAYFGAARDYSLPALFNEQTTGEIFKYTQNNKYKDFPLYKYLKDIVGLKNPYKTICSCVMIMNLNNIRKDNIFKKCLNFIHEYEPLLPDQDALNKFCEDKIKFINPRWYISCAKVFVSCNEKELREACNGGGCYEDIIKHPGMFAVKDHTLFLHQGTNKYKKEYLSILNNLDCSFAEKIFSVKNENNRKVIRIFGIKIKLKKRH